MRHIIPVLALAALAACENPDVNLGARISNNGISPSIGIADSNISVVVRP